jgi:hypothetical protein
MKIAWPADDIALHRIGRGGFSTDFDGWIQVIPYISLVQFYTHHHHILAVLSLHFPPSSINLFYTTTTNTRRRRRNEENLLAMLLILFGIGL